MMNDGKMEGKMTGQMMTATQIKALAELVCSIRPEWDPPGVIAILGKLGQDATTTTAQAIAAASNPAAQTPAAIAWQPLPSAAYDPGPRSHPGNQASCVICGRTEWGCRKAQANTGLDLHTYQPPPRVTVQIVDTPIAEYVGTQTELVGE